MSEVLEAQVDPKTVLADAGSWDSLAVVVMIAAIDEVCGTQVEGEALARCTTAGDVLALAGVQS